MKREKTPLPTVCIPQETTGAPSQEEASHGETPLSAPLEADVLLFPSPQVAVWTLGVAENWKMGTVPQVYRLEVPSEHTEFRRRSHGRASDIRIRVHAGGSARGIAQVHAAAVVEAQCAAAECRRRDPLHGPGLLP